jgi:integrase
MTQLKTKNDVSKSIKSVAIRPRWREVLEMWLDTKNSTRTRTEYEKIISEAMTSLSDLDGLTPEKLTTYRGRLMKTMNAEQLSSSTVALRLTALSGFLNFARMTGDSRVPADAINLLLERPPVNRQRPTSLSRKEVEALIKACDSLRDQTLICLAVETGLRCSELVALRLSDFGETDSGIMYVNITHGKGNKSRKVPLSKRAQVCLTDYLKETNRSLGDQDALFASCKGNSINTSRVRQILIQARKVAKIKTPISPHSLRHTAAMRWYRQSKNLIAVAELLGHASTKTTEIYLKHVKLDELAAVVNLDVTNGEDDK